MKNLSLSKLVLIICVVVICTLFLLADISLFKTFQKNNGIISNEIKYLSSNIIELKTQLDESSTNACKMLSQISDINAQVQENKSQFSDFVAKHDKNINVTVILDKTQNREDNEGVNSEAEKFKNSIDELSSRVETIEKNMKLSEISLNETQNRMDNVARQLEKTKEEFSLSISRLRENIDKSFQDIEKLNSEIKRLDTENRIIHYNYDTVLKMKR